MRKPKIRFPNRSDTNRAVVLAQKIAGGWKFWIKKEEELYYRIYCEADLRLCFRIMQIVGFLMMQLICRIGKNVNNYQSSYFKTYAMIAHW